VPTSSFLAPLGTKAPDFDLPSVAGPRVTLADLTGDALLVVFLCNHCPYVRHVESALATLTSEYADRGLSTVGIASNDTTVAPDDDPAGLATQVQRAGFTFPYLLDTTQEVALAYHAACTPDFFLFDRDRLLAYRGAFDLSRPKTDIPVTGALLRTAIDLVLAGQPVPEPHQPSAGCGIKWRPGNEPGPVSFG